MKGVLVMRFLNLRLNEIVEIYNDLQVSTETIVKRIIAEKDGRGLSNTDLADLLNKIESTYSGNRVTLGETIRKALYAKNPDVVLLDDLCKALNIPDINQKELILSRHYHVEKDSKVKTGRISEEQKRANQELYKESQEYAYSEDDEITIEEMVVNGLEFDEYEDIKLEENILAKLTLIFRIFPEKVTEFLQEFEFENEDMEEVKRYHVEVTYQ